MENNITAAAPAKAVYKRPSQAKEIWRRFRKGKGAVVGLICLVIILLAVLVGPLLIPYENATTQNFSNYLAKPSAEHLFGCDGYGRDILARVIHGGKTSLGIAILATITSCIFGSLLGAVAGFFGGKVDALIMRALDIFMSVPDILFTMAVVYALGANFINLMVALTLTFFTNYVRLVRSRADALGAGLCGGGPCRRCRRLADHSQPRAAQLCGRDHRQYDAERGQDRDL